MDKKIFTKELLNELLCIADTDWVLGHWYIKVMLNGRSLPDCTAFAGMGQDSLGHTRAIFRWLEDQLDLPEHQLEFGRQPSELHDLEMLSRPPQNWGDFLIAAFLAECAVWRMLWTFIDSANNELAGMVKHFGKELYFHRMGLEGWIAATSEDEQHDMEESLIHRGPEVLRWFGQITEANEDRLVTLGIRSHGVELAREKFLEDVNSVLGQAMLLSARALTTMPKQINFEGWDKPRRKTYGAAVPATLWEFMVPTDADTVALRRPLAVSVDDNLDLVDRAEYEHADSN